MTTPKIIVSLTTSPSRLPLIAETLLSILRQNPTEVVLNIPSVFLRTNERYITAGAFRELMVKTNKEIVDYMEAGVLTWNDCEEDVGPITKLTPILNRIPFEEDCWILTIDDDIRYLDGTIDLYRDTILKRIKDGEKVAMGMTGFRFMNNLIYAVEVNDYVEILEGYGSVCYHRSFFPNRSWSHYVKLIIKESCCKFSDDLVISNWLALNNIKRLLVSAPWVNRRMLWTNKCILGYGNQKDALHNGGAGIVTTKRDYKDSNVERYQNAKRYLFDNKLLSKELSAGFK